MSFLNRLSWKFLLAASVVMFFAPTPFYPRPFIPQMIEYSSSGARLSIGSYFGILVHLSPVILMLFKSWKEFRER